MSTITQIAERIIAGIQVQPGEVLQIRERTGRTEWLYELCRVAELAGATPLLDLEPPTLTRWLLTEATAADLARFGRHRLTAIARADRVVVLSGGVFDRDDVDPTLFQAWDAIADQVTIIEEERQLPLLVVAIPTAAKATQVGLTLAGLEAQLLPALALPIADNQQQIQQALAQFPPGRPLILRSGRDCVLTLHQGTRPWLTDDGLIDAADRERGAIVSNLPAGSIYTTVLEESTAGSFYVPRFEMATEVVLHFAAGRIVQIDAATGGDELAAWLDTHRGEPRRISHVGLGLNSALQQPLGWTLVDEHVHGALFVALGENRYMGGANESSLNYDLALFGATLTAG
ncbi:MAG: aminopeptidase [Caldilineaceae bacterium]|nr:aminopeptidase [Caldilineaceae bacterium]